MKKKLLVTLGVLLSVMILTAIVIINHSYSAQDMLLRENVAALAGEGAGDGEGDGQKCWHTVTAFEGHQVLYCGNCQWIPGKATITSTSGKCS